MGDQVAALEWVHDNIAAFGGGHDNVTIFGQSAGAMSIGTLVSMPLAEGLFRRATAQSGAAHQVLPAAAAGSPDTSPKRWASPQPARPSPQFLSTACKRTSADLLAHPDPDRWDLEVLMSHLPWQPVIDGDIIPSQPLERIRDGAGADIDLRVGVTTDEWRMFLVSIGAIDAIPAHVLADTVATYGLAVDSALASYRDAHSGASDGELFAAILSDSYVGVPVLRLVDAHATRSTAATFAYEFAWQPPQYDERLGACHGLDVPFVFDTLGDATDPLAGPNPPQQLAETVHAAWVASALDGDCGWPEYDLGRRATMRFHIAPEVVGDPWSLARLLWESTRQSLLDVHAGFSINSVGSIADNRCLQVR